MFSLRSLVLALVFACLSFSAASAASFTDMELTPVSAPEGFQHGCGFKITYFNTLDGQKYQAFPSLDERRQDADLILAKIAWAIIEQEYTAKGRFIDDWSVQPVTSQEILDLVSRDYVTEAWSSQAREKLVHYLKGHDGVEIVLNSLDAYCDYTDQKGDHFGKDRNPIILKFNRDAKNDEVAIFNVTMTED